MAQTVLTVAGYYVGGLVGGPWGAQIGAAVGSYIGAQYEISRQKVQGARLDDLKIPRYEYGAPLSSVLGRCRVMGQPLWMSEKRELATTTGGKGSASPEVTTFTYEVDVLFHVSDRPIAAVSRVWANGELIFTAIDGSTDASLGASISSPRWTSMTVYTGSASQLPDPIYEAAVGIGLAPAYRHRGTVMIEGLQLGNSGIVPALTFEVLEEATSDTRYVVTAERPAHDLYLVSVMNALYPPPDQISYSVSGAAFQVGDGRSATAPNWRVRSDTAVSATGKRYFEFAVDMTGHSAAMDTWIDIRGAVEEVGASASGYYTSAGVIIDAPVEGFGRFPFGNTTSVPRILMMAVDFDAELYWVGMDGAWGTNPDPGAGMNTGNPATGVGGRPFDVNVPGDDVWINFEIGYVSTPSCSASLRTTNDAFSYSVPTGFVPWADDGALATVWTPADLSLAEAVTVMCELGGLTSGEIDVTELASTTFPGLPLTQVAPPRATLEVLAAAFYFECVEADKLYFRTRGRAPVAEIAADDLGAAADASSTGDEPLVGIDRADDLEVPAKVAVQFINADDDYQSGTAYSDRALGLSAETRAASFPIVLEPERAQGLADTIAADVRVASNAAKFAVTDRMIDLEPTDVVVLTDEKDISYRVRVGRETWSQGVHTFEGVLDEPAVLKTSGAIQPSSPSISVPFRALTKLMVLDVPILQDTDDGAGHYAAMYRSIGSWPGAGLYLSSDDVNYTLVDSVANSAVVGRTLTVLGDWSRGNVFDEWSTVDVEVLTDGATLSSSTRGTLLSGTTNAMLIGDEIIQFRTATLIGASQYRLSGLLRGRKGTEWAQSTHAVGERVVLLQLSGIVRVALSTAEIGSLRYHKPVTSGRSVASTSATQHTNVSIGLKPYAPVDGRIARDAATGDATLTWKRRTRLAAQFLAAGIDPPLGEALESYSIEIYDAGSPGALRRTMSSSTAEITYTAAQQTTDGLLGFPLRAVVYQLSAYVGRGYPLEFQE